MCLRLTYAEALLWKKHASQLIAAAKAKSASIPCDPLIGSNPRLSSFVSEIDSIKKRHGLLIERALIFAINKLPNWQAAKEKIPVAGARPISTALPSTLYHASSTSSNASGVTDHSTAIKSRLSTSGLIALV